MEITKTKHYTEINSVDEHGEFKIEIQNDCSQIRIEAHDDSLFFNSNLRELKTIRDTISEVINNYQNYTENTGRG